MFDISKNLRDRSAEEEGTWMGYEDDVQFLVARRSNSKYKSFVSKQYRENEKIISSKANSNKAEKLSESIMLNATATHILKDWKGIVSNGKAVPYTVDAGIAFLDEFDDIRQIIEEFSDSRDNFVLETDNKDAENLKK